VLDDPVRILLVEDDRIQVGLLTQLLENEGYRVRSVATGARAIDAAEMHRPHLIFMDIGLEGGMDGLEAAVVVRKRTGVPVVFLTGQADRDTLERARESEPVGYLLKPVEPRQLRATVQIALQQARMAGERQALVRELEEARATIEELRVRLDRREPAT